MSVLLAVALGAASGALARGTTRLIFSRRRARQRDAAVQRILDALDDDAQAAFEVARHEARSRQRPHVTTVDILWGLLQIESFAARITELGGSLESIEQRVLAAAGKPADELESAAKVVGFAVGFAELHHRPSTCTTLWMALSRSAAAALVDEPPLSAHALSFYLVHGVCEPATNFAYRDGNVVLRNDDFTTKDFVTSLLREVFALSAPDAERLTTTVHEQGSGVAGRFATPEAIAKVEAARALARRAGHPLWVSLEPA